MLQPYVTIHSLCAVHNWFNGATLAIVLVSSHTSMRLCNKTTHRNSLYSIPTSLLGTEISSVDEAWFVKRKKQTLYWVLNKLLTNVHMSITCLLPRHLLEWVSGNEPRGLQCSCGILIWCNDDLFTEVRLFSPTTMGWEIHHMLGTPSLILKA